MTPESKAAASSKFHFLISEKEKKNIVKSRNDAKVVISTVGSVCL